MKIAVILIVPLPLVGFITTLLFGKRMGGKAHIVPVALVTVTAALAVYAFGWAFQHQEEPFVWDAFSDVAGRYHASWGSRSTPSPASCCSSSASSAC